MIYFWGLFEKNDQEQQISEFYCFWLFLPKLKSMSLKLAFHTRNMDHQ